MSWPVTARTGRATVKVFEEERELDILLLIDVSGSSLFGIGKKRKIDMYADLTALVGLAGVRSGDNVGAMFFNDTAGLYLRGAIPLPGTSHPNASPESAAEGPEKRSAPGPSPRGSVLRNRSLILVVSDFLVPDFEQELRHLSGPPRGHSRALL